MIRSLRHCLTPLLLLYLPAALAADPSVFQLGNIEVIGEKPTEASRLTTETLDADRLAATHREDLGDALELAAGVSLQNAGQRREKLIAVRGFSSRQVPVFIDGIPVYVPYDGVVDFSRFGIDYVSEIVVSRGLASVLYGPNILGGAINVISRRPSAPLEASARLSMSFDDDADDFARRATVSVGGLRGQWYGHATASYTHADTYPLSGDFSPVAAEDGGDRNNAGSRDTVVSAKLGFLAGDGDEYALSLYRQDGRKNVPPYAGSYLRVGGQPPDGVQVRYWQWPDWSKQSLYFVARNGIGTQGTLRWRLFHDHFGNTLDSYDDDSYSTQTRPYAFADSVYDDDTYGGNADFEWRWNAAHVTRVAAHGRYDIHRESDSVTPRERLAIPTWDFALEHEWRPTADWTLTPGYSHLLQAGRTVHVYDDNNAVFRPVTVDEASADNAQLVATRALGAQDSLFGGISRKTRFPTLKERFSGGLGSALPNPALAPERALHYELGYAHRGESWGARLALFQSDVDDAIENVTIAPDACALPPCTQLRNVGEQRHRGAELSLDASPLSSLRLDAQLSLLQRDNRSSPQIKPTGTPEYKLLLAADWQFLPQWHLRADGQREGRRYSNTGGTRVAAAFTRVNAFLRHQPLPSLGLELGVRNLTDALYGYDEGYYEAGRSWLAQIDWRY